MKAQHKSGVEHAMIPRPRESVDGATADPAPEASPAELTREDLEALRRDLESRRADLLASIDARRHEERDLALTRDVGDEMDDAVTEGVASMTSKLLERDVMLLAEINRALGKFEDGTYGVCEGTGEPVGVERLRLRPWARYSVAYQEDMERASRARGGV
jgi:DnaK suppressor protein